MINTAEMTTADFVKHRDANMQVSARTAAIGQTVGEDNLATFDANAIEVDNNMRAFNWGRVAAVNPEKIPCRSGPWPRSDEGLEDMINRRAEFLVDYQNQSLADRYLALLQRVRDAKFEALIDNSLSHMTAKSAEHLRANVGLYMDVRGYGPVKELAIKDVHSRLSMRPSADAQGLD